ncbi:MAG: response regulator [Nitrospinae bacterium]|nr:response regulator [Nitrospinota bacterium]
MAKTEKQTVLVVDDEEAVREFLSLTLQDAGYAVVGAENGKDASEILKKPGNNIDVIVSDLMMPVMNGLELAKYNYDNNNLPFVVCTALYDTHVAINLLRYNVQDYVVKPIDNEKLFVSIVNVAAMRNIRKMLMQEEVEQSYGNVSNIKVGAKRNQILLAIDWVRRLTEGLLSARESDKFINYAHEFLINSFEHGSLKIGEDGKSTLLNNGRYEQELKKREQTCDSKISVDLAVLKNRISIKISDEGDGFDFEKYLRMSEQTLMDRLSLPNGRGIYIAAAYFDSIEYFDGGASVMLTKNFGQ